MKKVILFDLDGTLTDPGEGIVNCVEYTLKHYGIYEKNKDKLKMFIGPPLKDGFSEFYSFDEKKSIEAVNIYRKKYAETGIFQNKVYDGISNMLKKLKENENILGVATSKPQIFADRILEKFALYDFFDTIVGSNDDLGLLTKEDVIRCAMNNLNVNRQQKIFMVGDRKHDILAAKKCGITAVGILFGYGSPDELESCNADYILKTVEELEKFLLGL